MMTEHFIPKKNKGKATDAAGEPSLQPPHARPPSWHKWKSQAEGKERERTGKGGRVEIGKNEVKGELQLADDRTSNDDRVQHRCDASGLLQLAALWRSRSDNGQASTRPE